MHVLGIDFGTSYTVGVLRFPDGRLRPLLFDGSPLLPSAVYLDTTGLILVGRDAERQSRLDPRRFEPHPKSRIDDDHVLLGDHQVRVVEVVGTVLAHVVREARRVLGADPDEVRLTHPVRWEWQRRAVLIQAARAAGIIGPRLIPEPIATTAYVTAVVGRQVPVGASLAIYDLGGGSFDAAVVWRTPTGLDVLADESLPDVGGLALDRAMVGYLGTSDRSRMLFEDVRGAKERLSLAADAAIHTSDRGVDVHLTRLEFEELVRPFLDRTVQSLRRVITAAGVTPVAILLGGGSSRIPLVARLIQAEFGVAPLVVEQPETVVAAGAVCLVPVRPPGVVSAPPAPWQPPVSPLIPVSGPPIAAQQPGTYQPPYDPYQSPHPAQSPYQPYPPAAPQPSYGAPRPLPPTPVVPTERHFIGELPSRVRIGREFSLIVEIRGGPARPGQHGFPFSLLADRRGTPLWIILRTEPGLEVLGDSEETMRVWPDRDSTPVRFGFRALTSGMHTVRVSAWSGGTFVGELSLQTSASDDRVDAGPRRVSVPIDTDRSSNGEATLLVEVEGGRYSFRWLTDGFMSSRALAEPLAGPPDVAVARTVETLRRIVQQESGYSTANARRWVTETGVGLWQDMVPDPIKDQFWDLRRNMRALYIACSDDWMPWELLYPRARRRDDGFLVQQFPVLRQVPDRHHSPVVRLDGAHCVVPPSSPTNAKDEVDTVRRTLLAAGVDGISDRDIDSLDELLGMLDSGSAGLLHFACHNGYSVESGGSFIRMAGGNFVPALLNSIRTEGTLARKNPLIFLNACRSAGIAPYYTRMMGWAEQFMSAGAGAFVGTLWPVETTRAATFAEVFYAALLGGDTLGTAGLKARRTIEDPADPSWLAYTIYGNPNAVATRR